ncbi:MAG: hypothetical protein JXR65_00935 [Bacteroidales bacterium]|nr:hypothetical protein [Bacteroidales bacterium]
MKITKENYGILVIDYLDGNLSAKDQEALLHFLDEHPDLKEEVEQLNEVNLKTPDTSFPGKNKLKKPELISVSGIDESNYEEFLLLALDQELSAEETESFSLFMKNNPQLKTEHEEFFKTRLIPDTSIVYSSKAQLRKNISIGPILWMSSVAAAIAVLLGWLFFFNNSNDSVTKQFQRNSLAIFEMPLQSIPFKNNIANPELLPGPEPNRPSATTPKPTGTYLRNPVLIAQLSPRNNKITLISGETPQIVAVQNTTFSHQEIMANTKPRKKKPHILLAMLEGGVKAVNFLTDKDMLLVKTYNQQGQLVQYQVLGDDFNFDKQINDKK